MDLGVGAKGVVALGANITNVTVLVKPNVSHTPATTGPKVKGKTYKAKGVKGNDQVGRG